MGELNYEVSSEKKNQCCMKKKKKKTTVCINKSFKGKITSVVKIAHRSTRKQPKTKEKKQRNLLIYIHRLEEGLNDLYHSSAKL